ncbi:sugar phosphate isomerase/epimerase family protein [Streptomyces avicenniae]|uniref:sugar phosphate isomerase/epimerase family protein n=1 Tax=Streptomyces avicenniae TaxID=500153 RepID=UPI00069B95BE|nr:sugar phosphate isomerase/epimerase family protein [Streptomyces avicenniae]
MTPLPAPRAARDRLGFATLGCPGAPLAEVIALARRHGCPYVELRAAEGEILHTGLPAARVARVREELDASGVALLALNSYVRLCVPSAGPGDDQEDALLAHVELAAASGARAVRVFMNDEEPHGGDTPTEGERRALERLARVAPRAAAAGVTVALETHDSHARADRAARFLAHLDRRAPGHGCGVVWDTAHTWAHGETPAESLALLRPWLAYAQIKDVRSAADPVPVPLGAGGYPVDALAAALRADGYAGPLSLEWELMWHPELPGLDEALTTARSWAAPLLTDLPEEPPA